MSQIDLDLIDSVVRGDIVNADALLRAGADANFSWVDGITPLHLAVVNGHRDIAALLLDNHANPNAENRHLNTPLHNAAAFGMTEIADLLIRRGADPSRGKTPLDFAMHFQPENASLIALLRRATQHRHETRSARSR